MTGAGSYPAGMGPAGGDIASPLVAAPVQQKDALYIDPTQRDAVLLPDGSFQTTHYVDQQVVLAIAIALGSIGSLSVQGSGLSAIVYIRKSLVADVRNAVQLALATLIANGDVQLLSVNATPTSSGFNAEINYRNLRLPQALQPKTVRYPS